MTWTHYSNAAKKQLRVLNNVMCATLRQSTVVLTKHDVTMNFLEYGEDCDNRHQLLQKTTRKKKLAHLGHILVHIFLSSFPPRRAQLLENENKRHFRRTGVTENRGCFCFPSVYILTKLAVLT